MDDPGKYDKLKQQIVKIKEKRSNEQFKLMKSRDSMLQTSQFTGTQADDL